MQPDQNYKHISTGAVIRVTALADIDNVVYVHYTKITQNKNVKNNYVKPIHVMMNMYVAI